MKLILICLCLMLSACKSQGLKKEELLEDAMNVNQVDASFEVVEASKEDVVVMLFHDEASSDHAFSIYQKEKGDGFTQGPNGKLLKNTESVFLYTWKSYYIYMSLNTKQIASYELYNNCDVTKGSVNPNEPFVLILPSDAGEITFYTNEGTIIEVES